ncbi:Dihydropyrimidine dehydrogenase (NADP(+)) [Populus alba x Populus x berolinensis]|nr:Dihydropyrimidine dehydrogenase (NADP(+)) [Populus alba x Populus x berolinensis]
MEEYDKAAWEELIDPVEQTGIVRFRHHQYSLSGIGGVETGGEAAEFILPGAIQEVCTGVMMHGYGLVKKLREELKDFMKMHNFSSVEDFRG